MTERTETTVLAALALAAQHYADPTPVYIALRELRPDVDWSGWVGELEDARQKLAALSACHVARFTRNPA